MNQPPDSQLLRTYAESRSETAFAELVRRHVDLTYSAALRMVRDPHLAEDVTQGTFAALAENAARLAVRPVLSGWLLRTARNIAAQTVRTIERRRARERKAVAMNGLPADDADPLWENIAPHLDAAMGELDEPDRTALLLRFFEKKSARAMAAQLGISEEAAQKRVNRAVARLRALLFARRGIAAGVSGLAVVLGTHAARAAPSVLSLRISSGAGPGSTTAAAAAATLSTAQAITMTTFQKALVTATFATLAGLGIHEARQASELRAEVESLRRDLAARTDPGSRAGTPGAGDKARNPDGTSIPRGEMNQRKTVDQELLRRQNEAVGNPELAEVMDWYARADQLKKFLELNPDLDIPELKLATRKDWMHMCREDLNDEKDYRRALSELRTAMVDRFWTHTLRPALEKYLDENGRRFPAEVALLKPYFETPVEEAFLRRYEVKPNANRYYDVQFDSDYVIRARMVDEDFDPPH